MSGDDISRLGRQAMDDGIAEFNATCKRIFGTHHGKPKAECLAALRRQTNGAFIGEENAKGVLADAAQYISDNTLPVLRLDSDRAFRLGTGD